MTKVRTLKGVAHDVVDHSMSAFGWLHPHVAEYAKASNFPEVEICLIGPAFPTRKVPKQLRLAAEGLQSWFVSLLGSYGLEVQHVKSAKLTFGAFGTDSYTCAATCRIVSVAGREFRYDRGWPPNSA